MRWDHIQPIGHHHDSVHPTGFKLGGEALAIVDEWLEWLCRGHLSKDSMLAAARGLLMDDAM